MQKEDLEERKPTFMRLGAAPVDVRHGLSVVRRVGDRHALLPFFPFTRKTLDPLLPLQLQNMSKGSWGRPVGHMEAIEAPCRRDNLDVTLRKHAKVGRSRDCRIQR